ncbi:hypothetical protein [uncultured Microbacterium sp.]
MDESAPRIEEPAPESASEGDDPVDKTKGVPDTTDENDRPVDNPSG